MRWFSGRKKGTAPDDWVALQLGPWYAQTDYQVMNTWVWPSVPAHEQRSALANAWMGNQLPGFVNFIPGVPLSKFTWNVPTSYANTLRNQQFNVGYNIQSYSSYQNATLQQQIQAAWQNRTGM